MPELTPSERLQPCLLDRLTDDEPHSTQESRNQRVISPTRFKQAVVRDVEWLFNARSYPLPEQFHDVEMARGGRRAPGEGSPLDLREHPKAFASVINFGVRQLCGLVAPNMPEFERELAQAIKTFEPRLIPHSVQIHASQERNRVTFEITGRFHATVLPDQLFIRTTVDLETGQCVVNEGGHG